METRDWEHDVAVVGMSCRFPGARDTGEYWRNLCAGVESIRFFSEDELLAAEVSPDEFRDPAYVPAHGVLADAYAFDAPFFGVSRREAEIMDPQQRVFLECAWSALEDAGCDPYRFPRAIGVFAGSGASTHLSRVLAHPELVAVVGGEVAGIANNRDFLTTRVSYKLGLRGPSVAVQTACSTSLVAIHLACQSLLNHECDLALSGGVTIAPDPAGYLYQEGGKLSPDGHCRAFDARAAGTVGGCGAGVVALKRVVDALREGDTIHAVVRGSAINNDGAAKVGFMAPSVTGQARAITEALAMAAVDPSTISYVEAHGTGTPLGDPIEIAALAEAFGGAGGRRGFCALGAVKTNIGHLDTAAGVAGFIKAVLALKHRTLPPTLHFEEPNPETGLQDSPFYVNARLRPWTTDGTPRRAGVSSFGIGGTNAHVVLEEAPELPPPPATGAAQLLVLSARSEDALERMRRELAGRLAESPAPPLADVAYTLQEGRAAHPHRWAAVARDAEEAREALAGTPRRRPVARRAGEQPPVAFLFPGGGTQYAGMARELYAAEPVFRDEIDRCARAAAAGLGLDLRTLLFPADGGEQAAQEQLERIRYALPALFSVEYALARLWMAWGVRPEAMLGHSMGEYVAACVAGVFSLEGALRLVTARARLMQSLPGGSMLAVPLPEQELRPLLSARVALAAVNSASHCVVSGETPDVEEVEALLSGRGVVARRLHVSHASHSPAMDPILEAFAAEVRRAQPAAPRIPFLSNVTGDWITAGQAVDPGYWVRHLRETVRFSDGVRRLLESPERVLLEVGPGETLGTFARRDGGGDGARVVVKSLPSADQPDASDLTVLEALASLWTAGVAVDWAAVRRGQPRRRVPLPTYPFDRTIYRVPSPARGAPSPRAAGEPRPSPADTADPLPHPHPMSEPVATQTAAAPERGSRLTAHVAELFGRLVGIAPERLDPSATFLEMGADSLLLMQASRTMERSFGVRVPFRMLLEGVDTIGRLAEHLDRQLPADFRLPGDPDPAAAPAEAPAPPPAHAAAPASASASASAPVPVPAPVAQAPAPAGNGAPPAAGSGVQEIVALQLAVMRQQLELLRGGTPAAAEPALLPASMGNGRHPEASPSGDAASDASVPADRRAAVATALAPAAQAPAAAPAPIGDTREKPASHGPHRPVLQTLGQGGGHTERQARHFDELVRGYTARTRRSKEYAAQNRPRLADNRAALGFRMATKELLYPVVGERSRGSRLWDLDGNEYIDFTNGFGVHFFGHRPGFITRAVEEQLRRGYHLGPQSDLAGPAAELLCELTGVERATFCNTGSEAMMTAVRIARAATGRDRIATFAGSYHGCFDGVLARSGGVRGGEPRSLPVAPGTPQRMVDDVVVLEYGAPGALEWLRANASDLAAVLVEPVQSRDPEFHPREFLRELRALTERSGAVLIFDEMITGFRLGVRGAQEWYGVDADLVTYGKVIGGGFPLGVIAGRARLMDAIDGGTWNFGDDSFPAADQTFFAGTFCKHPVAMAAACAVLRHLKERGPALYEELNGRAARLVQALREVIAQEEAPIRILHCASLFHFRVDPREPFADLLFYHLLQRGMYIWEGRACYLSTAHTDDDCDRLVQALRESLQALREGGFLPEKSAPGGSAAPSAAPAADGTPAVEADPALAQGSAPAGLPRSFPLTPAQRQVWVHAQLGDDASRAYHEQMVLGLRGPLDLDALRAALEDVMLHHEALRTVFDPSGEAQHVLPSLPVVLRAEGGPAVDGGAGALPEALREAARESFDLSAGPLFRVHVHPRGPGRHVLQLVFHHLVMDGLGCAIMMRDLEAAYQARREGKVPQFRPAMQFSEYAALVAAHVETFARQEGEWLASFQGATPLVLPTDRPRPRFPTNPAGKARLTLPPPLAAGLKELGRREGCTLFTTLLAGLLATLHRTADQDDIVVGIPSAGRPFPGSESLVGHCVDVLPLRSRTTEATGLRPFLREVRGRLLDAYEHEVFSHARLQEKLDLPREPGVPPLVSVGFNLEPGQRGEDGGTPRFAGLELEPAGAQSLFAKFDINIDAVDYGDEIELIWLYNADLFEAATIERMLGRLRRVLEQVAAGAGVRLGELDLLAPGEREQVLAAWNDTARDYPFTPVHQAVAEQAARAPEAVALLHGAEAVTYEALERRADALARRLRSLGVGPEVPVGLCTEPGPALLAGVLGIWKAGGAYVPLDPGYPPERLRWIVADASLPVIVTAGDAGDALPEHHAAVVRIDDLSGDEVSDNGDGERVDVPVSPSNLAYVIYTSGSTGRPKGVLVQHGALANLLAATRDAFGVREGDVMPALASFAFDIWLFEALLPLTSGAAVRLVDRDRVPDVPALLEEVSDATLLHAVPALMREVARAERGSPRLSRLRRAFVGGDRVPADLLAEMREALPAAEIHVLYGPTETAILASAHPVPDDGRVEGHPIGRPLGNVRLYVCDAAGNPQPPGVPGELLIGGAGVARGYLGRPALTAERFVPDPFSVTPGARLYRTGDRVRWPERTDALTHSRTHALEFLGRVDRQVKIRGFRIEPGEIEAAIRGHVAVDQAVVVVRPDGSGQGQLVAYVVPRQDAADERQAAAPAPDRVELWPSIGEYPVYDDLIYSGLTGDERRMASYRAALERLVRDRVVVDVGTGADAVLARMCVEAGARKVYAIEVLEHSCAAARGRIAALGLQDRIEVVAGDVRTVELPEPADVCVSEIVEAIAGAEGAAVLLNEARRLLKPDGVFIPERCVTYVAAASLPDELHQAPAFTGTAGHYVERIFEAVGHPFDLRLCIKDFPAGNLLTGRALFEELDFRGPVSPEYEFDRVLEVVRPGRFDGLLLWLRLEAAGGEALDILEDRTAWFPAWFPVFHPGVEVHPGDRIELHCRGTLSSDGVHPDYAVEGVLHRGDERLPFAHRSPHHEGSYRGNPFHARLFAGEKPVVAPERPPQPLDAALRTHLTERLPAYMVPGSVVVLDRLPLTPNGKLDVAALPAPQDDARAHETLTPVEEVVAGIWAEVLRRERVGARDNFFALGGHSLQATRVASRLREVFGVELKVRAVFDHPTVAGLAQAVEAHRRGELPAAAPVVPVERTGALPLSFAQERLWFLDRMEPGSAFYNVPAALRLEGALDAAALERALGEVVRRHEALRTTFGESGGAPVQVIAPFTGFTLPVEDLSGLDEAERGVQAERLAREAAVRPFDLAAGPLFRATLLRLGNEEHVLLLCIHHVVSDGWSMGVLFRELFTLYGAYRDGRDSPLPELPVQYADYAVWQRRQLRGEALERELAWWKARLAGAPALLAGAPALLALPADHARPPVQTYRGAYEPLQLPGELLEGLQAVARREGATLYMVLLAAFQVLLAKYGGSEDVVVGSPIAGRTRREVEGLIGFFANTLVLRTDLSGGPEFREVLRRVREVTLGAYEHQEMPFERLVEELQPERSLSHSPVFQVLFVLQDGGGERGGLPGLDVHALGTETGTAKFDLALDLTASPHGLAGALTYSTDLFERGTIARMLGHLRQVLEQVAADAGVRLGELDLLAPGEREQVLAAWNDTARDYPFTPVHQAVVEQAARAPEAMALLHGAEAVTYEALERRAAALAQRLRSLDVGPEVPVGLCAEPGPALLAGVLGIWKAGGAYVPLDPGYPPERLGWIVADASLPVIVTAGDAGDALPEHHAAVVRIDDLSGDDVSGNGDGERVDVPVSPSNLAYVIYTSGSTGRPKGVLVQHGALANLLAATRDAFGVREGDVMPALASFAFDIWLFEALLPLTSGAAVRLVDRDRVPDVPALLEEVSDATLLHAVPALMREVARAERESPRLAHLRRAFVGGDRVPADLLAEMREALPAAEIHVLYGPTETAVLASAHPVPEDGRVEGHPIGRPLGNVRLYVCDAAGNPQPPGVPGELLIGGAGVARGYLGRPALTAERFVPDPFSAHPGARLYRTGDRVRWTERTDALTHSRTHALEFLGRVDRQVKIRGFRIEPGEIEAVLRRRPGVSACAVLPREDAAGETRLVAYVAGGPDEHTLRERLRRALPDYMVPAAFVAVDRLPLTPNGKLDVAALPAPDFAPGAGSHAAPRTPVEEVLAAIWTRVLRLERVGVRDNFFALGGHSLLATRVVSHVRDAFGVEVPVRALFEGPTVAELAVRVEALRRADLPLLPPVVPVARTGALPLSFTQERLWFLHRMWPEGTFDNIPTALRLEGALDAAALERALGEIVRRHEALRTTFEERGGEAVQVIAPFSGFPVPVEDLSALGEAEREAAARRRIAEDAARPFDLAAGPLFRAALLRLAPRDHVLLLCMHHVVCDGWSMGVLFRELSLLYAAYRDGGESPLPELPVQYADFAVWQREQLRGEALEREMAYWKARLAGAPALLELPADRPRPAVQTYRGAYEPFRLSGELPDRLQALARREGATLYMVLLGAFQVLLSKYAGSEDVVVGSPVAGRTRREVEELIGYFVNTLVLRTDLSGDPRFSDLLARVRETTLDAYEHQDVPFEKLVAELQPERSLSHAPIFQASFALQNNEDTEGGLPELRIRGAGAPMETAKLDLSLDMAEAPGALVGRMIYSTDLFDRASVVRMVGHLERVLEQVAADPGVRLSRLSLLDDAERRLVVDEWNRTGGALPDGPRVHELFQAQAAATPEAEALRFCGRTTTYRELDEAANRLAHHLLARGVGPETRVGVFAERAPQTVVSILAVLKAGGAYLPLDPAYPAERLRYMLADSGARLVIAPAGALDGVAAGTVPGLLDPAAEAAEIAARPALAPDVPVDPDGLAYLVYTSGSTGWPKGVMVPHRGVPNLVRAQVERFAIGAGSRVLQFASFSFDAAVSELFTTLLAGGTLVLAPRDELLPGPGLLGTLRDERVSVATLPPSVLAVLPSDDLPELRTVVSAGEAVDAAIVERWSAGRTLLNAYGPTEATVCATCAACAPDGLPPMLGRPIDHVRVYVLDAAGEPAPVGVPGELCVGGAGVARGYLGQPALTAERFVPDPFAAEPGSRLYRTGDRARWMERTDALTYSRTHALEYLGRADEQVKVRGFRIEPGEVEAALRRHAGVRECAVVAREDVPGSRRLVAYVVPAGARGAAEGALADALREHLRERLPEYMVPAAFVVLDGLPLTPNGKLDRRALPAPEFEAAAERYAAPRSRVEEILAAIWAEVLGLERVGVNESFFGLGGDSILCIQVVSLARQEGVEISPPQMFDHQTIAELAAVAGGTVDAGERRAEQDRVDGTVRLTPIQAWFFAHDHPAPWHYNQSALLEVDAEVDDVALEAALSAVLEHHDALRLRFRRTDAGWEQWHADEMGIALERIGLSHLDPDAQDRAQAEAADRRQAGLDLERGPLGAAVLFDRGARGRVLFLALHHLVVDAVSWRILREDLERACAQRQAGQAAGLGAKSTSYRQWAETLEAYAASGTLRDEAAHWLAQGADGVAPLPVDGEGGGTIGGSRTVSAWLEAEETRALLQEVPAAYRTQINDVLLCALADAVGEWTGGSRVRLALEGHGREEGVGAGVDLTRTVGWFTSVYPVVLDTAGAAGPGERLKRVKEQLRAVPKRGIGYGVLRYLSPDAEVRDALAAQPEPEISFNYLGQFGQALPASAERLRPAGGPRGREWAGENRGAHALEVNCSVAGGTLELGWTYGEGAFPREAVEGLAAAYLRALRELIAHSRQEEAGGCTPSDFPLAGLTQDELDAALGTARGVEDLYPLSPMQEGMLFHALASGESQEYQAESAHRLEGRLDVELFRRAWAEVVDRHPILRTAFVWDGLRRPLQRVDSAAPLPWRVEDWRGQTPEEQEAALQRYLDEDRARGFDLRRPPLMRCALFRVGDEAHWFVWSLHHLLMDGWACARVVNEAFGLYEAWSTGRPVELPRARPYRDYIAWLQRQDPHAAERYWREVLAGYAAPLRLGADAPAGPAGGRRAQRRAALAAGLTGRLEALARRGQVTLNTVVMGAWGLVLSRYAGEEDVVFGTTVSGRSGSLEGVEEMVGLFINTLPVRMRVRADARLDAWLAGLQRSQAAAREYEYAPLVQVQSCSDVPRGTPLFETHFIFENYPIGRGGTAAPAGDAAAPAPLRVAEARGVEWNTFPLSLMVGPGRELQLSLSYDESRFEGTAIGRMLEHLARLLQRMADAPGARLGELEMMGRAERARVVEEWNRTDAEYPAGQTLHGLFEEQAARTPDAVAVVWEDESLTYRELNRRANRLAHHLRGLGVGAETRVGLCLERGPEQVVSILAVLKAGGAYVPLDPGYPAERLAYMLADSGVPVLLVQERLRGFLPAEPGPRLVSVDALGDELAGEPAENPRGGATPRNLAYVIYTSGSTGRPKGVMNEHGAVVNRLAWMQAEYGLGADDVVLQKTPFSFDVSVWEFLWPLQHGASLVVARPDGHRDPAYLQETIERRGVTTLHFVPSMLQAFAEAAAPERCASLRRVICSGEALSPGLAARFHERFPPPVALHNLYGPTEAAVDVSHWACGRTDSAGAVPIGRPVWNTRLYVLDGAMRPVPAGVPGELYIGGVQVARGYLHRPGLTAERFIPDPFSAEPGARLYRTGDRARWTERTDALTHSRTPALEYLGRLDEQVKLRGFRVEPGEVEAALRRHPAVRDCAVAARPAATGETRLVAYVVGGAAAEELRGHLRRSVPDYMVPAAFVAMDALPLTPSGKLDRRSLPDPEPAADPAPYLAPRTPAEAVLAGIWSEVLGVERAGAHDHFFDLGGHSLGVMRLTARVRDAFGVDLPIRAVFAAPTLEAMAAGIERRIYEDVGAMPDSEAERLAALHT